MVDNMHALIFGAVVDFAQVSVKRAPGAHRIATHLRKEGMDVEVVDFSDQWTLQELKDYFKLRVRTDTVFLGCSATFDIHFPHLREFLYWVKDNFPTIPIVGGTQSYYNCTNLPIDWLVHGYGEVGISALVRHLTNVGTDLKYETHEQDGHKFKYIDCTNNYPGTKLRDFSIDYEERDFIQPSECLTLELARGCIFNCHFCTLVHRNNKEDLGRDADNVYQELLTNYEKWGTTTYTFSDETVNDYPEKLEKYAKVVTKLPFRPRFGGYARGDLLVARPQDWDMIWDLGFDSHFYGIESFNHESARSIGKGMDPQKLQDGLLKFKDHFESKGFYRGHINLIAGLPGETPETLQKTFDWLDKNWWPTETKLGGSSVINPLWIPSGRARPYDDLSNFAKDPAKWGYLPTTLDESHPRDANGEFKEFPSHPWNIMFKGIYQNIVDSEGRNDLAEGGGLKGMTFMNWKNDSTNALEMLFWLSENWFSEKHRHCPPAVHSFHTYLANSEWTWDDMSRPQRVLAEGQVELNKKFIQEYKDKKFNFL